MAFRHIPAMLFHIRRLLMGSAVVSVYYEIRHFPCSKKGEITHSTVSGIPSIILVITLVRLNKCASRVVQISIYVRPVMNIKYT